MTPPRTQPLSQTSETITFFSSFRHQNPLLLIEQLAPRLSAVGLAAPTSSHRLGQQVAALPDAGPEATATQNLRATFHTRKEGGTSQT